MTIASNYVTINIVISSIFYKIWLTELVNANKSSNDNKSSLFVLHFAECMMCTLTIGLRNQLLRRIIKHQGYNIKHSLLQYIL